MLTLVALGIGALELLIILVVVAVLPGVTLWGIISAATIERAAWDRSGDNKTLWIVLQLCTGVLASLIFLIVIRPKLKRAALDVHQAPGG